jgi:hypothetical protein
MKDTMKHFETEIYEFLDGESNGRNQRALFRHLSECEQCMRFFEEQQVMNDSVKKYYKQLELPVKPKQEFTSHGRIHLRSLFMKTSWPGYAFAVLLLMFLIFQQQQIYKKNAEAQNLRSDIAILHITRNAIPEVASKCTNLPVSKRPTRKAADIHDNLLAHSKDTLQLYVKDMHTARFVTVDKNDLLFSYTQGR